MNKARKKTYKGGIKRLVNESLILSSTRFVSSRAVRFFETGFASPLLGSVKSVDRFCKDKIARPMFKKMELRKNFTVPVRNRIANFIGFNPVFRRLESLYKGIINTSLRSVGVFLLTFGIYCAAIFFLKRYISISLGEANINDFIVSAITIVSGLLLAAFGDKSLISALGSGKITGSALLNFLGINNASFEKASKTTPNTAIGISFLLGSLLGVLTLFVSPVYILSVLLTLAVFVGIMNVPEFGLLLSIFTVSFASLKVVSAIVFATVLSHFVKWLRLKRNIRFGTADVAMVLFLICAFAGMHISGDSINCGEYYLLGFFMIYFTVKNLISSEKLLYQSFAALCNGLSVGMALYILGEYAHFIPHEHLRNGALMLTSNVLKPDMLALLISAALPFAFAFLKTNKNGMLLIVLSLGCAVVTDSFLFYALILVSLFVFIALAFKAPAGSVLGAVITLTPVLLLIWEFTASSSVSAFSLEKFDNVLENTELFFGNFWQGLNGLCGPVSVIMFIIGCVLNLQRILGCGVINQTSRLMYVSGTVASSVTMVLACSVVFNPFADLRMILVMFFVFGLCGSVYKVCSTAQNIHTEV